MGAIRRSIAREKKKRLNAPIPPEKKNTTLLDRFFEGCGMTADELFDELNRRIKEDKRREG